MKTILSICLLAIASIALNAQTVTITGQQSTTQTNVSKRVPIPQVDRTQENRDSRAIETTPIDRHTLTFTWRGKLFTVTDDEVKGPVTTTYQTQRYVDSPELAKKVEALKAAQRAKAESNKPAVK